MKKKRVRRESATDDVAEPQANSKSGHQRRKKMSRRKSVDVREERNPAVDRIPMGSTLDDILKSGASIWVKMGIGAIVSPIAVLFYGLRGGRGGAMDIRTHPVSSAVGLLGVAVVGAVCGAALTVKDVVEARMEQEQSVPFPLRLLFGYGLKSLLLVWVPLAFFLVIVVPILWWIATL